MRIYWLWINDFILGWSGGSYCNLRGNEHLWVWCIGDVVIIWMYQYIEKQDRGGGIFRRESDGVISFVVGVFKDLETVCPYKNKHRLCMSACVDMLRIIY